MKKLLLLLVLAGVMPLTTMAQDDDLYFTPSKEKKAEKSSVDKTPTYYSGIGKDVDEYNRRGKLSSYYQKIGSDSLGNDIITFQAGDGVYPDSSYVDTAFVYPGSATYDDGDDYTYTRRMARWDGYYDPWFYDNYYWGPYRYGWYSPWYYGYAGWYDPWYYGWYDPWYYGYYGWGYPYYWGGWYGGWYGPRGGYAWGTPGTRNHGFVDRNGGGGYGGHFGTRRDGGNYAYNGYSGQRRFGSRSTTGVSSARGSRFGNAGTRTFGSRSVQGTRSYTPSQSTFGGNRSFGSSSGSFGGGSFGGSRSGGFSGGGHAGGGGGGHFGGRR